MNNAANTVERQMSESFRVGALLACVGGFLDAFTYLVHGHVFANAQTGNIVLLGISLAQGNLSGVVHYLFPILAFIVGIGCVEFVRKKQKFNRALHWRQWILFLEVLILILCVQFGQGQQDALVNTAISLLCALQVQSFRKVHGHALATTMCTGNLRSTVEGWLTWRQTHDPNAKYRFHHTFGVVLCFLGGAALGVLCIRRAAPEHAGTTLLIPLVLLLVVCQLLFRRPVKA